MRVRVRSRRIAPTVAGALFAAGAVVVSSAASLAQSVGAGRAVALDWTAPEGCPTVDDIEGEIERLLAGGAAAPRPLIRARAAVQRERAGEWRVDMTTETAADVGHRTLTAESCRAAADATALILALAVDPERVASNRPPIPSSSAAAPAAAPDVASAPASATAAPAVAPPNETVFAPPAPRAPSLAAPSTAPSTTFEIGLSGALDLGTLPTIEPGALLTAAIVPAFARRLRLEANAGVFATSSANSAPSVSGDFHLRSFDAGACFLPIGGSLELGLCADGELEWMSARGIGETAPKSASATWVVVRPHATFAYELASHWALRADVGAGIALDRPDFTSSGVGGGSIHRSAEGTGRASLGIEARF